MMVKLAVSAYAEQLGIFSTGVFRGAFESPRMAASVS